MICQWLHKCSQQEARAAKTFSSTPLSKGKDVQMLLSVQNTLAKSLYGKQPGSHSRTFLVIRLYLSAQHTYKLFKKIEKIIYQKTSFKNCSQKLLFRTVFKNPSQGKPNCF